MLKIIGIAAAVLIGGFLAFVSQRPDQFRVERTASIKAPPEKIYTQIQDLKAWAAWSPYEKKDPAMKRSFGAVTAGKGATYAWDGDKNVGKGRMEIISASQPSKVIIQLTFIEPFEANNVAEFTVAGQGEATTVTWAMYGHATFLSKLIGVFLDMDKMVGTDFEAGLANLKTIVEK